ncbi:MAG: hypothetical protein E4H40_04360 [Candidatus Brocadiia bacterium]|nr:MAG: hypothetical protein E4H40_04360 [Candidatus Brocadiia bacterium]
MSWGAVAAGTTSAILGGKGKKSSDKIAGGIVPEKITTGYSFAEVKKGNIRIDPSIRAAQDSYLDRVGGLRDPINAAFGKSSAGIDDLQARSASLRADYEGNSSAYRDAVLNPLRESIAQRKGELDRSLNRTDVRGSFAEQAKNTLSIASGRELSDQEAIVENNRINALGDFLGMDADLLKAGLTSETGRIQLLASLEDSLRSVSTERFNQEMLQLGLPSAFTAGNAKAAGISDSATGVRNQAYVNAAGEIIRGIDNYSGPDSSGGPSGGPGGGQGMSDGGDAGPGV